MNLDSALQAAQRLYMDTAPLIYYLEENPSYVQRMDRIFGLIARTPIALTMPRGRMLADKEFFWYTVLHSHLNIARVKQ